MSKIPQIRFNSALVRSARRPAHLVLAAALGLLVQSASFAATVSGAGGLVLEYDAGFNETNDVELKPNIVAGKPVLDIRDFAGLNGCTRFPSGSVISIRCPADQLVFFSIELDSRNDVLVVNEANAVLTGYSLFVNGGLGDDDITGGSEEDEFYGGSGNDLLIGEGGIDALYGEAGDDRLIGGSGSDQLDGGSGTDILFGEAGADRLDGGSFDDFLDGGSGQDTLRGGSGDDRIHAVDGERDTIDCGLGRDIVRADPIDFVDRNCEDVTRVTF